MALWFSHIDNITHFPLNSKVLHGKVKDFVDKLKSIIPHKRIKEENNSQAQQDDFSVEALFNGCTDKKSLEIRYHDLLKTFHPDNQNGDTDMTQRINSTYKILRKRYK